MSDLSHFRSARITGSRFADIMSDPRSKEAKEKGVLSKSAQSYLYELIAEFLTGNSLDHPNTGNGPASVKWGHQYEPWARKAYEELTGNTVTQPGFCTCEENLRVGVTPDGLIGEDRGIEIKCPYNSERHIKTACTRLMPDEYTAQVQGSLWVTGRQYWDFVSYDPRQPDPTVALIVLPQERDEKYISKLKLRCEYFLEVMATCLHGLSGASQLPDWHDVVELQAHNLAHLIAPPITLKWKGQPI